MGLGRRFVGGCDFDWCLFPCELRDGRRQDELGGRHGDGPFLHYDCKSSTFLLFAILTVNCCLGPRRVVLRRPTRSTRNAPVHDDHPDVGRSC